MIYGPLLPPGVGPILVAIAVGCVGIRWIAPFALRVLAKSTQSAVGAVAAVLILPEYCVSTAIRRRQLDPPQFAYDYGAVVGWIAFVFHRLIGRVLLGAADALRAIPMTLIGVLSGGLMVARLFGLIAL